jgi:hypothetical protein
LIRLLSSLSRFGLAVAIFLMVLGVLRWGPVHAEPPWDVRALPPAGAAFGLAVLAAITGRERRPRRIRSWLAAAAGAVAGLALVVAVRGPAGLSLTIEQEGEAAATLPPMPVDVSARDLGVPAATVLRWSGPLRPPVPGRYRLWIEGRGRAEVWLDGRRVVDGRGERFRAEADVLLTGAEQRLEATLERTVPGYRLRLGWTRPDGRDEIVPPRYLGPPRPPALWRLTDFLAVAVAALAAALGLVVPWERPRPLPAPGPVTRAEVTASLAGYALLLAIMSWPLVLDPARSGVVDRPDGRLNAWILAWDVHALLHEPGRLFQAPIFHPLPDTLAFSENLLLPAVLAAPALLAAGPVLGYNVVLTLSMVVSGLGAQLLVRRVSGDRLAAFVAGAIFAAGAHRWVRLAHLHAQVTLFLPLALLALDRFWERRTLRRALLVGLLLALQGLSSIYLGAITATVLAVAVVVGLFGGLRARDLLALGAGAALAAAILAPVARPYLRMRAFQGEEFSLQTVAAYAGTLESYAAGGTRLWGALGRRHLDPERVRDTLFPGLAVVVLGFAGLAVAPRRYRAVALAASAVAIVLSLGPETALYRFLHEHVVFVRGIRALARFSLVPVLCLAVLAGLALAGRRWVASLLALVLAMLESSNVPLRYGTYDAPPPSARWLAGKEGAVAYLPLGERDTEVMLQGMAHLRPLVNGDSGFMPRHYTRAMELLEPGLSEEGLRLLRALDVRHVVSRRDVGLPLLAELEGDRIHGVPPGEAAAPPAPGKPAASLWGRGSVLVDLGEPKPIGSVSFELGEQRWIDRPLLEVSEDGGRWERVEARASLADAVVSLTKDPRRGRGEVRFPPRSARYVRLDPRLPLRPGPIEAGP